MPQYLMALLILVSVLACSNGTASPPQASTQKPAPTPTPTASFEQLKEVSEQISYDDLFRNNENHVGKQVWFKGKIIQVIEDGKDEYQLRANVTPDGTFWDDTVFLSYEGPRLLEDDLIEFIGKVEGLVTYEAVLGQEITIPALSVLTAKRFTQSSALVNTVTPPKTTAPMATLAPAATRVPPKTTAPMATPAPAATRVPPKTIAPMATPAPAATRVPPKTTAPMATPAPTATLAPPTPTPIPSPTPGPDREALLRQSAIEWGNAISVRDWATVYTIYSDEFQSKCPLSEFAEYSAFLEDHGENGIPRGATYILDSVIIEGDYAWVNSHFVKDGRQIFHDEDQYMANEPAESVWKGDRWVQIDGPEFLAKERPCNLEQYMGRNINLPLPVGSTIPLQKGRIDVTGIVKNATQLVMQENQFNDPPKPGNHFYMVAIEWEYYRTGSEPARIDYWDFELIGGNRTLYEGGCGVFPNALHAELYPGGTAQANLCFEVSDSDSGFILIYPRSHERRIFLRLEE